MDDRELAEKVIEILPEYDLIKFESDMALACKDGERVTQIQQFVRDWRVAGALMERCITGDRDDFRTVACSYHPTIDIFEASLALCATPTYGTYLDRQGDTMPRAIIEACVAALEESRG